MRGPEGDPLDVAERALAFARGDAQVAVTRERSLHARFARSAPTQATAVDDVTVHVLAVRDGRTGAASTNATDADGLRAAVDRADAAADAAASGDHPGLPGPAAYRDHGGHDPTTAALDPAAAGAALTTAFAVGAEHGLEAFGLWTAAEVRLGVASTAGVRAADAVTDAFVKVVLRDPDGRSGYATSAAVAADALDVGGTARRSAATVPRGPLAEVGRGALPVVLGPDAVAELLGFLGLLAFNGLAHAEGRGALTGRLGTAVAAPIVTLTDDPAAAASLPRTFDADGVPKEPLALIDGGVARAVAHDTRSAARAGGGARSTGHALAPGGSPYGPLPTNLVLAGGDAAGVAELCAPIERGLLVNRLWYTNAVVEKETLLTGVTRDGTFLVEDGAVTRPARDVRFTDSALGVLQRTEALTAATRLVGETEFYGRRFASGVVCPALRCGALRITGGA